MTHLFGEPTLSGTADHRLAELVDAITSAFSDAIVRHRISEAEWYAALEFLTTVGKADEFVLLSDTLGLSVLVNGLDQPDPDHGATPSNVLGPFWRAAPDIGNGGSLIADDEPGERLVMSGIVRSTTGAPIAGALVDVWQSNAEGFYDVQMAELNEARWRGRLRTNSDGSYEFRTVVPPPYEVKKDGPVGQLLDRLGRHHFRPAHIHYMVTADGYQPLTTMVFFSGDPWLGNDAIGADKPALTVDLDRGGIPTRARFDIALVPAPLSEKQGPVLGTSLHGVLD